MVASLLCLLLDMADTAGPPPDSPQPTLVSCISSMMDLCLASPDVGGARPRGVLLWVGVLARKLLHGRERRERRECAYIRTYIQ